MNGIVGVGPLDSHDNIIQILRVSNSMLASQVNKLVFCTTLGSKKLVPDWCRNSTMSSLEAKDVFFQPYRPSCDVFPQNGRKWFWN